jgi:hypothetical protein
MVRKRGTKHMRLKGEVGQSVLVKATIDKITITRESVTYNVCFEDEGGITLQIKEENICELDEAEDLPEEAPADEKKIKKQIDEAMDGPKDIQEKPKKKRGRPRKATIESIMEKAEKKKGEAKR